MLEAAVDWDRDMGSAGTMNSSQSTSVSSSSRSSFEAVVPQLSVPSSSSTCKKPSPHRWSSDLAWDAINRRSGPLGPRDYKLLHHVGSGDIGTVYVCRLRNEDRGVRHGNINDDDNSQLFAMKVVDKRELEKKKKLGRAEVERRVLRSVHHPFLPTLYADFDAAPHYSCVVMEFCPAGDLYSLRHRQPERRFDYNAARFYAAEVLVALEYLHMLGIIYRDLKPENVLIRPDGHVMLSDFDLSLECTSCPTLDTSSPSSSSPSCLPFFLSSRNKNNKNKSKYRFTAEPVEARSFSFVGTHEYVAPEVAAGRSHGSAVDWWAFGVFVHELLHGRTPFVGPDNESTLRNIVRRRLVFPGPLDVDPRARDLITRLLAKDPARRLGSRRGATDVKAHPFFSGVNFALLRSQRPPIVPTGTMTSPPKPTRFDYF